MKIETFDTGHFLVSMDVRGGKKLAAAINAQASGMRNGGARVVVGAG